jgi:hypothetical protein
VPRKVFVAGEILTATDVNTNLMDQAVMVFDDEAARTTAIPSPIEGMVTYLKDTDSLDKYTTVWEPVDTSGILQVVSTTKTNTFSESVAAAGLSADITGLTATITPSSASSKIFVSYSLTSGISSAGLSVYSFLHRDGSAIAIGDTDGSRRRITSGVTISTLDVLVSTPASFLDSPNSTSALTYSIRVAHDSTSTRTIFVNRSNTDTNAAGFARAVSSITLMEVKG